MVINDTDRSGGFIGMLYVNKTENLAVSLVREGLATVAQTSHVSKDLKDAEDEAKASRKNVKPSGSS